MPNKAAVLVLAAGKASRMGKPKQLLPYNDSTILKTVLNNTLSAQIGKVYCVLGAHFNQVKESLKDSGNIHILENKNWQQGIGSSISYGVKEILKHEPDLENILIVLADQPLIPSIHYQRLMESIDNKVVAATKYKPDHLGVPAVFGKDAFQQLLELKGRVGAKKLIASMPDTVAISIEQNSLKDIDTPEDYNGLNQ
jgi:molybdenum cofactor cytidylyltransferase